MPVTNENRNSKERGFEPHRRHFRVRTWSSNMLRPRVVEQALDPSVSFRIRISRRMLNACHGVQGFRCTKLCCHLPGCESARTDHLAHCNTAIELGHGFMQLSHGSEGAVREGEKHKTDQVARSTYRSQEVAHPCKRELHLM